MGRLLILILPRLSNALSLGYSSALAPVRSRWHAREPWEYHYPTAFGNQYVEHAPHVRLRDCILGEW